MQDKGKGKGKPVVEVWPTVLELLMGAQAVSEGLVLLLLAALRCNEQTTKELFEVLSAKDITEALQSQSILEASSIIERALLFDMCKNLFVPVGRCFCTIFPTDWIQRRSPGTDATSTSSLPSAAAEAEKESGKGSEEGQEEDAEIRRTFGTRRKGQRKHV